MLIISKAAAALETDAALGANETSRAWRCNGDWFLLTLTGTFSSQTVTLQSRPHGTGSWATHVVDDPTGAATSQTFTAARTKLYVAKDQEFRVTVSNGGSPDIDVFVSGPDIQRD